MTNKHTKELLKALRSEPRLTWHDSMLELTQEGIERLSKSDSHTMISGPLYNLWTELLYEAESKTTLLIHGLARSAELWESFCISAQHQPYDVHSYEAMDRMFSTLWKWPELLNEVRSNLRDSFRESLVTSVAEISRITSSLSEHNFRWTTLASSVVSLFPSVFSRLFEHLSKPEPSRWMSTFAYFSVLGYPAGMHPWLQESPLLWDRLGLDEGLHWSETTCNSLSELLDPTIVLEKLATMKDWTQNPKDKRITTQFYEEFELLLEDGLWDRRCQCLVSRLEDATPAPYWDDEIGLT